MWPILVLLLFARESSACDCPGITINGTDQAYCWQIVDRNASTWSSADDACSAVGGRIGQPEDNSTLLALKGYLKTIFSLPVLTGYVVGNAETGEFAVVCRANRFLAVANDTEELILGDPSLEEGCVFITNDDYRMHYGPCDTAAVVLCSQPEESSDYCSVPPTCSSTPTTVDYNTTTTYRTTTPNDVDNSTRTTASSTLTGTFSTLSTRVTTGNDSIPDTTTLLPVVTTSVAVGGGTGSTTIDPSTCGTSKSTCRSSDWWLFSTCDPNWSFWTKIALAAIAALLFIGFLSFLIAHFGCRACFNCKNHQFPKAAPVVDVEKGPSAPKQTKAVQSEPVKEEPKPEIALPPPVTQTAAVIPAPIPIDYSEKMDKPETEDKGMMTDPWEPEPVIIYKERAPEPKVHYERDERMVLPPPPMTARSEEPPFFESDEEDNRRIVAGPTAVIVRGIRRREPSPPLESPRDPFPALPRRALSDDNHPMERFPVEKKKPKRERPRLEPVVFLHNAKPDERPFQEEPEYEPEVPAAPRGPRAFPPPPPASRERLSSPIHDRPFPEQYKSPSPAPKLSRPLPSPPQADPLRRDREEPEQYIEPAPKRPVTRTPVNRPVITQQPMPREERSAPAPPPAARPLPSPPKKADPPPPSAKPAPTRSSSGGGRAPAATPVRARSSSPVAKPAAPRATSPFAPKNSVSPAPQGSLFKAAPANAKAASNLRAANGKLGGVAGGHGEVPRGWKAWSANNGTFSTTPGSDL